MIILHITFTVSAKSIPATINALREVSKHIVAEPTCHYFNVYRFSQPGTFRLVEMWEEGENFLSEVYPSKDYLKTYLARMEEIGWRDRKLEVLDEVEGFRIDRIEKDSEV